MTWQRLAGAWALVAVLGCRAPGAEVAADTPLRPAAAAIANESAAGAADRTVTDAVGRTVTVPAAPRRVVSLAPALTETLFAVGAGDLLVGVTRFCDHPPAAAAIERVGGFSDPDVERIVSLRPDLVIATADTVSRARFDSLVAAGLAVYAVNPRGLDGVAETFAVVGTLVGRASEGRALEAAFRGRIAAVESGVASRPRRRALFLFSTDPLIAAGPGGFVDELLRRAGGENVLASAPTSYPRLGVEGVAAARPAVILTTAPTGEGAIRRTLGPVAATIPVVAMEADLVERPGPRLADGFSRLAAALHPETPLP